MLAGLVAAQPSATSAAPPSSDPAKRPLYTFSEEELGQYLPIARQAEPDLARRVVALGRQNIGQPYDIYLLGEFPFERYDPDPIYCLTRSDCVTFCEHTYAMALSSDWWEFLRTLQRIRYRDGIIGMVTRNHETLADWNHHNAFLFEDLTTKLGQGKASVPLKSVWRPSRFFAQFGIGQDVPDVPIDDAYIPRENLPSVLGELRDADFINIIRGDANSQWAGHTGLVAIAPDGTVDFLHSAKPAVREQPLAEYVENNARCLGIKVLRLRPDAEAVMRATLAAASQATEVAPDSFAAALAKWRQSAPPDAKPAPGLDWRRASRLQAYRLEYDTPTDVELQAAVERIDHDLGARLGIPDADRALGVLDLRDLRLAMIRPDEMFYAASVPKICILLAYFETHPEAARDLAPRIADELGRMIKLSDNALAARYGQEVGLEKVQELLQSDRYRFYDQEHGGGFWYGKHYAQGEPRIGDPLHDHSHGATVRQCLRYYLMMEQLRLVNPAASTRMREIFASPHLEHLDSSFVAGLQGRDLSLIRKSGTWEDWHLDTARVEHGGRAYLLAGMVHHPQGEAYLSAAAAAVDELLCGLPTTPPYRNQLVIHENPSRDRKGAVASNPSRNREGAAAHEETAPLPDPGAGRDGSEPTSGMRLRPTTPSDAASYESPVIEADLLFNEALLSWNVGVPPDAGFRVEGRVGRRSDGTWSPYLHFSDWGPSAPHAARVTECDQGRIDVDYFTSEERFDRFQYRIIPTAPADLRIARVAVCLSDTTGRITSMPRPDPPAAPDATRWRRTLPVPFRSQGAVGGDLAGRICSPTSVSMVLEYRGVSRPTQEVAARIYDPVHDLYGNWPRAVQAAFSYGVPGYLARFSSWPEVEQMIAADQPLIISITAGAAQLDGAPYESTDGHLLVLTGFDGDGYVTVNDPAARDAEHGRIRYHRTELEQVWLRQKRGTAYVLLPPPVRNQPADPPSSPTATTQPSGTHVDLRVNPLVDMHFSIRRLAAVADASLSHAQLTEAVEAVRRLDRESGSPLIWGLLEAPLSECNTAAEAQAMFPKLPESFRLRDGQTLHVRDAAVRLADVYAAVEPWFLAEVWPRHQALIETARGRLAADLLPKQKRCYQQVLEELGMTDPGLAIPVDLVAEAPPPGAVTHRRRGGGGVCFVSLKGLDGTLLYEAVLHESIHALDVATQSQDTVLQELRHRLREAGCTPDDPLIRDLPHTLMFVQAGETIRRCLDAQHRHYGDALGYYAKVPQATQAVRPAWEAYLRGELTREAALTRIVEQALAGKSGN